MTTFGPNINVSLSEDGQSLVVTDRVAPPEPEPPAVVPLPGKAVWEERMVVEGRKWGSADALKHGLWEGGMWYYDGMWVLQQIADYTGESLDAEWQRCWDIYYPYATNTMEPRIGLPTGYRVFPHGFEAEAKLDDDNAKHALVRLATRSAYGAHSASTIRKWLVGVNRSREAAYLLQALLACKRVGIEGEVREYGARTEVLTSMISQHFNQWFGDKTATLMQPFMVGLSAHALIEYTTTYDISTDWMFDNIERAAQWLMDNAWNEERKCFYMDNYRPYESWADRDGLRWAIDLNMLVAPMYAWLWKETGDHKWQDFGDKVFGAGTTCEINTGKQLSQNYRLSFLYVKWRESR